MKKSLVARGFAGALSLCGVLSMIGCGAEVGDGAAGDSAEIGSNEQAISINTAHMNRPVDDSVTYAQAKFPSLIKVDSNNVLVMGGYTNVGGVGSSSTAIKKFNYTGGTATGTWSDAKNAGNVVQTITARGEAQVIEDPANAGKYYLIGGRSAEGGTIVDTIDYIDTTGGNVAVSKAVGTLTSPRVNFTVQKCGTALLVSGGVTTGGAAVKTLEKITGGASPVVAVLKDDTTPTARTVIMRAARSHHVAQSFSSNLTLVLAGGDNSGALSSTEKLTINSGSACVVDKNSLTTSGSDVIPVASAAMPSARYMGVFFPVAITISSVAYDGLFAAGSDGSTAPTTTFAYKVSNDTWTSTSTPSISTGRVYPSIAFNGSTEVALVGGSSTANTLATASLTPVVDVDLFANSGAGSFSSPQDLDTARLGAVSEYIGATPNDETSGTDGIAPVAIHGFDGSNFVPRPE